MAEHRPSTTRRQSILLWAVAAALVQVKPCCFSCASVSLLQLLRGRPLFLFPCGFQVRAWRVVLDAGFLRVCPIQPHFLRSICLSTESWSARSHSSSFLTLSCHLIFVQRAILNKYSILRTMEIYDIHGDLRGKSLIVITRGSTLVT